MKVGYLDEALTRLHDAPSLTAPNIHDPPAYHHIILVRRSDRADLVKSIVIGDNDLG